MADLSEAIKAATERLAAINGEIETCGKEALALEQQARDTRKKMADLKLERETLNRTLGTHQVVHATQQAAAEAAAAKSSADKANTEAQAARQSAELLMKELDAKKKELDELIAKAKEPKA